jgi:predicted PurR-regulated permease PerM
MQSTPAFNSQVKQLFILFLLGLLIYFVLKELFIYIPGLLGAITLYIVSRGSYFQLVYHRKWKKGWTAGLYLLGYLLLFGLLVYITVSLVEKRIHPFLENPDSMISDAREAIYGLQQKTGFTFFSEEALANLQKELSDFILSLLNDTVNLLANLAIMLFILYYMLVHGKEMENFLEHILPLKQTNIQVLAAESKRMIRASAIGIPIISLIQGLTATFGYWIFSIPEYVIWGFLTGVLAFFPVLGTLIIWVPLVIFQYASGDTWNAMGLMLYSLVVTGNIDYVSRITLLKKLGNIHPVVTILGVIVGLKMFGFIGFIFGPLLVNYIILLFRIYTNEYRLKEADTPGSPSSPQ